MDDEEEYQALMRLARAGDGESLLQLIAGQQARLYRIARAYLKDDQDALDALQETTFRAYQGIAKLKDAALFQTWLTRILLNCCNDEYRRRSKREWLAQWKQWGASQPSFASGSDLKVTLEDAVRDLPTRQKEIIILKYTQQYTLTEIAVILGCPEGTVKTGLHKALGRLRGLLGREVLASE
ncbi:sigma-70 family RNA polymerase sigma factor [Paenibacillus rhizovicinus]|uniref:Sigma-70 family RNA polymerase sigma factor n=1 Tax=Paenibacillus rhizovicinus TaxID=2704463 RepID=A0A6C0NXZ6_9BACL|nr:sigma-70 family RNA polymerase sigma factor [Paenibacillus rhizovicinus]QHW31079.1 sigma-70 family RNA polymerase sigma factor [Paenibacillus rhizovicinus]